MGIILDIASTQYLSSVSGFTPPVNSSVSFWCTLTRLNQISFILVRGSNWYLGVTNSGGTPPNSVINALQSGAILNSSMSLQASTLYHIVCTATASARQIFINGVLDNSSASGGIPPTGDVLFIGIGELSAPEYIFSGNLEDIRIFNRILSLAEVQTIYASRGLDGITYGQLHRWPLNELPIGDSYTGDTNFGLTTSGGSDYSINWTRLMGGDFPNISGLYLISVSIYVGANHLSQARVAVYQGGTTTLPTGASLVEDLGQTTGSVTTQWLTLLSSTNPTLTANTPIWVALKGSGSFDARAVTSATGDWYAPHGRTDVGAMGADPTVSYPSTVPSGGVNAAFWYSFYLTYGDGSGTGQMKDIGLGQLNMTPHGSPPLFRYANDL